MLFEAQSGEWIRCYVLGIMIMYYDYGILGHKWYMITMHQAIKPILLSGTLDNIAVSGRVVTFKLLSQFSRKYIPQWEIHFTLQSSKQHAYTVETKISQNTTPLSDAVCLSIFYPFLCLIARVTLNSFHVPLIHYLHFDKHCSRFHINYLSWLLTLAQLFFKKFRKENWF